MLFLYIILVLCTIALVWTAVSIYVRVRTHLREQAAREEERKKHEEVVAP